jgi:hypothetical protein
MEVQKVEIYSSNALRKFQFVTLLLSFGFRDYSEAESYGMGFYI